MLSSNVKAACDSAGLVTPCHYYTSTYNDGNCTSTKEFDGIYFDNIFWMITRRGGCGWSSNPGKCSYVDDVFAYAGAYREGAAQGVVSPNYYVNGKDYSNKFALCASKGAENYLHLDTRFSRKFNRYNNY